MLNTPAMIAAAEADRGLLLLAGLVVLVLIVLPAVMLRRALRHERLARRVAIERHRLADDAAQSADEVRSADAPVPPPLPEWFTSDISGTAFLARVAEAFVLRTMRVDQLPAAAIRALELGCDGDYLRRLAGWTESQQATPDDLFRRALDEQGMALPSREGIIRDRLRSVVDAFLDGRLDISSLAQVLKEQVGDDAVRHYSGPAYHLWCYAADWHDHDTDEFNLKGLFEKRAREEAQSLRHGYLSEAE